MDINKLASITQLRSEQQKEIAEIIGIEAYRKLVEHYGGSSIYINKFDTITRPERDMEIRKKFNGANYHELAKEYGLSETGIRKIINKK